MVRSILALCMAALAVTGCVSTKVAETPAQRLYAAHGEYNIALGLATGYAESAQADPKVVATLNDINQQVAPNIRYAHALIACANTEGDNALLLAARIKCGDFKFDAPSINSATSAIKDGAAKLLALFKNRGTTSKWETSPSYSFASLTLPSSQQPKVAKPSMSTRPFAPRSKALSQKTAIQPTLNSAYFFATPKTYLSGSLRLTSA